MNRNSALIPLLLAAATPLLVLIMQQSKRRNRRVWSENWLLRRNEGRGLLNMVETELRFEDPDSYKNFLRMSTETFDELHGLVKHSITKQNTNMRESISSEKRLALTLRFLATGESYRSLMYATRIHESTISVIIPEVVNILYDHLKDNYLKMPTTVAEWKVIIDKFETLWNFPTCLGAIDGKHIKFRPPRSAGSYYYNYKGDHSIVLLGIVDAEYKFLFVNVGVNGRVSDGGVFRHSGLKEIIDSNVLNFPPAVCLPGQNTALPYTFVADEAFALSTRLMKPYGSRNLDDSKRIFNYRLSRARRVAENAFGILANRFRFLLTTVNLNPTKVENMVLAACALHNYLAAKNPLYSDLDNVEKSTLLNLEQLQGPNRATTEALQIRDSLKDYFTHQGAVDFQYNVVNL